MLFQPIPFPDTLPLFGGQALSTFDTAPVDPSIRKQMFNVHSYCCAADQNVCKDGEPKAADYGRCSDFHDRKLKKNKQQAGKMNIPLIVTEFGACSSSKACYLEMLGFEKAADKYLTSWAYWMYKSYNDHTTTAAEGQEGIFNDDGTIQKMKEKALTRTYILYYQGIPEEFNFNDNTKEFNAIFQYDKSIEKPSVIYINKDFNYKNNYKLTITDIEGKELEGVTVTENGNYIEVLINNEDKIKVKVNLKAL